MVDFVLDVLGLDWSRWWVRLRAALLVGLIVCFPLTFKHVLGWYADHRAQEIVKMIPLPSPPMPTTAPRQ